MQVIENIGWAGGEEQARLARPSTQVCNRPVPELAGRPGAGGCKGCKGRWRGAGETTLGPHLHQPRCIIFKSKD